MNVFFSSLVVLVVLVIGYSIFSFFRIQGLIRESRVLVRGSIPYQRATIPEAPKVLFVGDSTGAGVGAPRPEESLAGRFGAEHPDWNVGEPVTLLSCGNVASALLFPRPLAFLWERRTLLVRDMFMRAASKQGVTYFDLYRDKKTDPFFLEPYRYHASDLFHPSGEGYGLWYENFKKSTVIKP